MDLTTNPKYFQDPSNLSSHQVPPLEGNPSFYKKNPFEDNIGDPLCNFNLKETSEFVKALPMGSNIMRRRSNNEVNNFLLTKRGFSEAPSTPGRPIFSFSSGNATTKKCFPSKWDDAEKWLNGSSSCNDSPAHHNENGSRIKPQAEVFADKSRVTEEKISKGLFEHQISTGAFNGVSASSEVVLKDKFTNEVEPIFPNSRCSDPTKEGFLFGNFDEKPKKDAVTVSEVAKHRDVGTEMTPLGSSTTSRCPTPIKSTSPVRHNTPASRSGPLALTDSEYNHPTIDMAQLKECHLAKLQIGSQFGSAVSAWSSREEEEEDISKSLRHFEFSNECRKSVSENRACKWEEEEKNKCCLRYQREEARIQAWVNLQSAKAEAQSKKLEVKIQKMRSDLEEKLMKRMAVVHRKAEEWRADAKFQHSEQIQKTTKRAQKMLDRHDTHFSSRTRACGCFPCNSHI